MAATLYVAVFAAAETATWARADIANGRGGWSATGYVAHTTDTTPPTSTTGDDQPGITISGLTAGTSYKLWAVWDDGSTSSSLVSSSAFATPFDLVATDVALSGTLTTSGDLTITPAPTLNLVASTLPLSGAVVAAGDIAYKLPLDLVATAVALSGTATVSGDLGITTAVKLDVQGQTIAVSGTVTTSGDITITPAPTLNLVAGTLSLTGQVTSAGDIAVRVPFNLAANQIDISGALSATGDVAFSSGTSASAVWNYVLSNGFTAGENVVAIRALLEAATPADIVAALMATVLPVNVVEVNSVAIKGTGVEGDTWGPA